MNIEYDHRHRKKWDTEKDLRWELAEANTHGLTEMVHDFKDRNHRRNHKLPNIPVHKDCKQERRLTLLLHGYLVCRCLLRELENTLLVLDFLNLQKKKREKNRKLIYLNKKIKRACYSSE